VHWRAVGPALARRYRLHVLDLPGFGLTPLARRSAGVFANSRLVGRLLQGLDRPAVLMGNSMGALIALLAAREAPDAVAALVLVAPPAPRPLLTPLEPTLTLLLSAYTWPVLGEFTRELWVRFNGPDRLARDMLETCCSAPDAVPLEIVDGIRELAARRARADDVHAYLAAYRSTWRYLLNRPRFDALLRSIDVPTLVIEGTADRLLPRMVTRRIERIRPDWSYVRLEGVGHMPQLDAPKEFLDALTPWLGRPSGQRRGAR
jgi:pimeloyl-ACP methyl ester carboxylesterase